MKGDLAPVAFRLSSALPSRTHYWSPPVRTKQPLPPAAARKAQAHGRSTGRPGRALIIGNRTYASIKAATKALRVGKDTIYRLIDTGEAKRA